MGISAKELIKRGQISDYDYYAPNLDIDFSDVRKSCGDYNTQDLENKMSIKRIYGDILKYYKMLGKNEQAIAYCININHSKQVCDMFNMAGIPAKHMDATTPEKERQQIMEEFKEHKFTILCNCNLISEGITLPSANVGLLLRPTLSLPLYIQQACRVLTPVEEKKAIIIDYVGNVFKHGMPTDDRNWSLNSKVKEYDNENIDGTFKIRVCQNCFSTFKTAPICPYCGAIYEATAIEIQNMKEIELRKIEEAKEIKRRQYAESIQEKVKEYNSPKEAKNWFELVQYCKVNGYKVGYAFVLNKRLGLNYKPWGK